jgi:hypothetical protein
VSARGGAQPARSLFDLAPEAGSAPLLLFREPGFSLKLLAPAAHAEPDSAPAATPPGQGQILTILRGRARLRETGGDSGKVVQTARPAHDIELPQGWFFRVANDALWELLALEPSTLALVLSTSVPREAARADDLLAMAARRPHMAPRLLFSNEAVRVELVAARGRLPGRGWVPWQHRAEGVEYALALRGSFRGRGAAAKTLAEGSLQRIERGAEHSFAATGPLLCVGLVISGTRRVEQDREQARGFTPFAR